jgi:hypothetical protein
MTDKKGKKGRESQSIKMSEMSNPDDRLGEENCDGLWWRERRESERA